MTRNFALLALAVAMVAAACGSSDSGEGTEEVVPSPTRTATSGVGITTATAPEGTDDSFPVTIAAPNGPVTIAARPERVVSLSPTSTEVLFAVGAGDQVAAVDSMSNFPEDAPVSELSAFTPSVEAIAAYEPDLVILSFDPTDIVAGLEAIGIPAIVHATAVDVDDAVGQWEQVGAATGHLAEAAALIARTSMDIEAAFTSLPEDSEPLSYYYELDPTYFSVTSATFIGGLIAPTGMGNIADMADSDLSGYPQLSAEYIIDSDPGLILLADTKCCGASGETIAERPGWDVLTAVENNNVVELDDDVASRWGPRITDLVQEVVAAILELEPVNA
jgi:iron complex transport system substrate-binding protein